MTLNNPSPGPHPAAFWAGILALAVIAIGAAIIISFSAAAIIGPLIALAIKAAFWIVLLGLYFLPAIIANKAQHPHKEAIGALNLMLGWTFIGWVAAMVWAFTVPRAPQIRIHRDWND